MKKLSVLFALLAVAMMAKADFVVTASDTPFVPGSEENELVLTASESMQTFTAFQFDMVLPEGLTLDYAYSSAFREEKEKGKWIAMHNWQEGVPEDGEGIRIFVMDGSNNNASFADVTEIITLGFIADATFKGGTITFKKAVFSSTDSSKDVKLDDFDVTVTVAGAAETEIVYKTNGKYGTLILPFDAELPANYKAYTVSEIDGKDLVLVEASSIVAFTPYVMEGDDSEVTFTGTPGTADKDLTFGLLTGVVAEGGLTGFHGVDGSDVYICQKQGKEVSSFYKINPEKGYTIPQYRCYLTAPKSGANMYRIGGTTGIDEVTVEEAGDVYDMLGRKVIGPLEKGVYIKNNRKIFVK